MMWEGCVRCARCHLWANGHRAYEKPRRASNGTQPVSRQCSSTPLRQCPPSFLPGVPALASLSDGLLAERCGLKETSTFPNYSKSWCLSQQQNENEDSCLSSYPLVSFHMLTRTDCSAHNNGCHQARLPKFHSQDAHGGWKESTDPCTLSSDLHTHAVLWAPTHMNTHKK